MFFKKRRRVTQSRSKPPSQEMSMSPYSESITRWSEHVKQHFPHLSRPQAQVLAWYSYAAQALQCCGQSQVVGFLALLLDQKPGTLRQRLREWTWEIAAKAGKNRQEVAAETCFGGLVAWVVSGLPAGERRLALALDATSLKQTVVVLTVSVLYCGVAIPIAWQVLPAIQPGAWRPHWLRLLAQLSGQWPTEWQVLVLADRGLYATWLFEAIQAHGWHPFLRIKPNGQARPAGASAFQSLLSLLPANGQTYNARVECFKTRHLAATVLIYSDAQYRDAWIILTDLSPAEATIAWYGLRAWIEAQFKDIKSGGWQWEHTRMTDPARISRLWLVLALALLCTISLGSQVEAQQPASQLSELPPTHMARRTATGRPRPRLLSLVTQGWLATLVQLVRQSDWTDIRFALPNPWPAHP
jgi:hypothetical protein